MMPWHIGEHADCSGFAVIKDSDSKAGRDAAELKARLEYVGLEYTAQELVAIRDRLIANGIIEIV